MTPIAWIASALAAIAVAAAIVASAGNASRPPSTSQTTESVRASSAVGAVTSPDLQTPTASPVAEPTIDPLLLAPCTSDGLAMAAAGWSGATGSMGGGATVINMSNDCRIGGNPGLELLAADGAVIASGAPAAPGKAVPLRFGAATDVIAVWSNWCHDPPARPLRLRLSLADGGGTLSARVADWEMGSTSLPRCDTSGAPSTVGAALPFRAPEPPSDSGPGEPCSTSQLDAFLGGWGAAAGSSYAPVVILNRSDVPCSVAIAPTLELRDAAGELLVTGEPRSDGSSLLDLPAGATAISFVGFSNWCVAEPKLPFQFDLRFGGQPLTVVPTSDGSQIGLPYCNSAPETPPPSLFLSDPFALPSS